MDEALQGLMQIRRCRGSCKSGAAKADENKPLQTLMQLMRCKARGIASCEALREHQHEASISGFSIQVGGIGRQAFEFHQIFGSSGICPGTLQEVSWGLWEGFLSAGFIKF